MKKICICWCFITTLMSSMLASDMTNSLERPPNVLGYDSLYNYLGAEYNLYWGQTLIFCPYSDKRMDDQHFVLSPYTSACEKTNVFRPNADSSATCFDSLVGEHFYVSKITRHMDAIWLTLVPSSGEECYFRYFTYSPSKFPFVIEGHYLKMKQTHEHVNYYARRVSIGFSDSIIDVNSHKPFRLTPGSKYECKSVFINNWGVRLMFTNDTNSFTLPSEFSVSPLEYYLISERRSNELAQLYGDYHARCIVVGNVISGMNDKEVMLALGQPNEIEVGKNKKYLWKYYKKDKKILVHFKDQKVTEIVEIKN